MTDQMNVEVTLYRGFYEDEVDLPGWIRNMRTVQESAVNVACMMALEAVQNWYTSGEKPRPEVRTGRITFSDKESDGHYLFTVSRNEGYSIELVGGWRPNSRPGGDREGNDGSQGDNPECE